MIEHAEFPFQSWLCAAASIGQLPRPTHLPSITTDPNASQARSPSHSPRVLRGFPANSDGSGDLNNFLHARLQPLQPLSQPHPPFMVTFASLVIWGWLAGCPGSVMSRRYPAIPSSSAGEGRLDCVAYRDTGWTTQKWSDSVVIFFCVFLFKRFILVG